MNPSLQIAKNILTGIGGALPFLALTIWGWGDYSTFFAHPARVGLVILCLAGATVFGFSGSSFFGTGRREDKSNRWIFIPLIVIALVFAWLPPHFDRLNRWNIDGDVARYIGLLIATVGGYLRLAAVFELGHRFSMFVAVQPDHELKVDGLYRFVRHPSYLGALLAMIGWALVFRSAIGLLLVSAIALPLVVRIRTEEDFLVHEFGEAYRAYQKRTPWRLFPFIY